MIPRDVARPLCLILAVLTAAPAGMAQKPVAQAISPPLSIVVLEGNNAINSVTAMHSVAPVIEVRDENGFPFEGATVVFTLPADGPAGGFATGGTTFTTRSDSHGQAAGPYVLPRSAGKFRISVTATFGNRKAEAMIEQTNSQSSYSGPAVAAKPFYLRRKPQILIGGAIAAGVVVLLLTRGSSSTPTGVSVSPGIPVFH